MLQSNKLLVPNGVAFIASFCIMVLELTAGRIVARYLGSSLYTWTSVIGVVLTGIAVGNYIGGRIADRFEAMRSLSLLFILASVSCATVPVLNHLVGKLYLLWLLPWSVRIALHVGCTFFVPSLILGMIAPVVAKFALEQGLATGRTIGNIYAWGAAGSIVGTFFTGFFLIALMGTAGVIWSVAGVLAIMGILFARKNWLPYLWVSALAMLAFFAVAPQGWAQTAGQALALRKVGNPEVIYEDESQYSYIEVESSADSPGVRRLILDQLVHSVVRMDESGNIQNLYPYQRVYEDITRCLSGGEDRLNVLFVGGGGYVFPRYIEKHWPGSRIDVVEIDPAVTEAAFRAFGLSRQTSIRIFHMDARNHIDNLIRHNLQDGEVAGFDFVYGDAVAGMSVPYQLTTYEYNEKIKRLLSPEGVYMINLIDSLSSGGEFLGAVLNTLRKSFPHVYVYMAKESKVKEGLSNTFVVAASLRRLDSEGLADAGFRGLQLEGAKLDLLEKRSDGLVLTDDYAPVENLLAPVAREKGIYRASVKLADAGNALFRQGESESAARYYRRSIRINPDLAEGHNNLANALAKQGRLDEAVERYNKAIELHPEFVEAHFNLGAILAQRGKIDEAIERYRQALRIDPDIAEAHNSLGNALFGQGKFGESAGHYREALRIRPDYAQAHNNMGTILAIQKRIDEAIDHYREALRVDPGYEKAHENLNILLAQRSEPGDTKKDKKVDSGGIQ